MSEIAVTVTRTEKVPVTQLHCRCGVRYWEDAKVDGVEDTDGSLIPCRQGDSWCPVIELATGRILNWRPGVTAEVHYKVCDDGDYELRNDQGDLILAEDGYVPSLLCPEDEGHGDYVIMEIDGAGLIKGWKPDLSSFEPRKR